MTKDTLVVTLSDMHTGGTTALFPNRFWQGKHNNHTPTSEQVRMWEHFQYCAEQVAQARKGKNIVLVHDGDAIEGHHHGSPQMITPLAEEQRALHVELMTHFTKAIGFTRGDRLYYVTGTEVHTDDSEDIIGRDMGAVQSLPELYAHDELRLEIHSKRVWWVHHGPTSGKGPNKGNGLRNWLRDRYYEAVNEGIDPPHVIITGHTHDPYWQVFIARYKGEYFPVRGLICPSWQMKTRYAFRAAPLDKNKIGLQYFTVTKNGDVTDPVELLIKQSPPAANGE